ncbi:unnamed protein product [Rotaria socialis]|uniref:ubiquitinyl hydrolase 1 n=1 Tax=Rotaria socialis TaxID=392032 RepID=A0A820EJQ4_9BILA|nr:unnamed protein product [Rotaria socialis]
MDKVAARTGIYHEHQQSALCGQHALNNLLQSSVFSVDSLVEIAKHLDNEERNVLTSSQYDVSKNMNDLPKLIMDNKIIDNINDLNNYMNEKITVPQHVYNEYQKNPNDPQIQQKLLQYVPKHIADQLMPTNVDPSHPQHDRAHPVLIMAVQSKSNTALSTIPQCDYPRPRHNSSVLSADHVPQYIVNNPGLLNSNEREQQRMLFSSPLTIVHQSSNKNDPFTDNRGAQQMIQSLTGFDTQKNNLTPYTTTEKVSDAPENSPSINSPFYKDPIEEWNQQQMEAAIAASLITNNPTTTTTTKPEETSERTVTTNVSAANLGQTPSMNQPPTTASEPERISMTNLGGTSSTNSARTPTLKLSTKSLNAAIPTTTNLSPPTIASHDVVKSLNIEGNLIVLRKSLKCLIQYKKLDQSNFSKHSSESFN